MLPLFQILELLQTKRDMVFNEVRQRFFYFIPHNQQVSQREQCQVAIPKSQSLVPTKNLEQTSEAMQDIESCPSFCSYLCQTCGISKRSLQISTITYSIILKSYTSETILTLTTRHGVSLCTLHFLLFLLVQTHALECGCMYM